MNNFMAVKLAIRASPACICCIFDRSCKMEKYAFSVPDFGLIGCEDLGGAAYSTAEKANRGDQSKEGQVGSVQTFLGCGILR